MIARADALSAMEAEHFDLVVIGGGITGAGVALDAASRGYSVALVERDDYAAGTSSRSSKLVHGGLRYLQNFDLGLVREALFERALMVKLAPHLVTPLPFVVPFAEGRRHRLTGVGLNMYDVLSSDRLRRRPGRRGREAPGEEEWSPDRHRTISGEETVAMVPALADHDPASAYLFYDCQTDDVRLVLTVLGEAERFGAVCANRCEVTGLIEEEGKAMGVRCVDRLDGDRAIALRADNVVNATGVWADRIKPEELYAETEVPHIRPSRGTHVTLAREALDVEAGVVVPAGSGREIFVLPWLGRTLVGTTDRDYDGDLLHVAPDDGDIDYLLDACNKTFQTSLDRSDLTGAYAGVRPLISTDPKKSVDISRKAELYETSSGLVTITGGKLTTWRRMAKMAVDRIVERDGAEAPCRTHEIPLGAPVDDEELARVDGVDDDSRAMLARRYGYAAHDVLALVEAKPSLGRRIVPDLPDLLAEAAFAARREQAATVADVLLRRTRLGLLDARVLAAPDAEPPAAVAAALGGELGWEDARGEQELAAWHDVAAAEGIAPR